MPEDAPLTLADVPTIDLTDEPFRTNPAAAFDAVRQKTWIIQTVRGYEVLNYDIAQQMCVDPRFYSIGPDYYRNLGASEQVMWYATQASLPMIGGERHDRIRRALQRGFTRRRIDSLRPQMRSVATRLIDALADRDPFDLVADFSTIYPLEVLCALMGVPAQDIDRFGAWTIDLGLLARFPLEPHMVRIDAAITGLREYFRGLLARRHRQPGEDFVSTLIAAQKETGRLTEDELHGALLNLLFAGQDTTRYQFGWVVQLLLQHEEWERLDAAPDRVPCAIEEAMRLEPTLHILLRKVVTDVEYCGLVLPAGTLLAVNTYAANRDPAAFPDPHRFDVMRANAHRHLGFGHGGHLCLGHGLARTEMAEALTLFVERLPGLQLAGEPGGVTGFSSMTGAECIPLVNRQQRQDRPIEAPSCPRR
ncbi:cytochrome P450 [Streptomyces sp. bgisy031]|uniref:cytochrome P450 n=1 Tax=Streptomyces sp. bgisy031 TaxID=3413772 RepID=UPI003D730CDE